MGEFIIIVILVVIAWNIKEGFNMIDGKLETIIKQIIEQDKNDS